MVGIIINDDWVARPIPVVDISELERRDTECPAVEPETIGAAAGDVELSAEAARPAAMLKRTIEVETCIVRRGMPDPGIVPRIHVRPIGMPGLVLEILPTFRRVAPLLRHVGALLGLALLFLRSLLLLRPLLLLGARLFLRAGLFLSARRGLLRLRLRTVRRDMTAAYLRRTSRGRATLFFLPLLSDAGKR